MASRGGGRQTNVALRGRAPEYTGRGAREARESERAGAALIACGQPRRTVPLYDARAMDRKPTWGGPVGWGAQAGGRRA